MVVYPSRVARAILQNRCRQRSPVTFAPALASAWAKAWAPASARDLRGRRWAILPKRVEGGCRAFHESLLLYSVGLPEVIPGMFTVVFEHSRMVYDFLMAFQQLFRRFLRSSFLLTLSGAPDLRCTALGHRSAFIRGWLEIRSLTAPRCKMETGNAENK